MSELPPNTENIQIAQQLSELSIVYTKFRATKGPPMKLYNQSIQIHPNNLLRKASHLHPTRGAPYSKHQATSASWSWWSPSPLPSEIAISSAAHRASAAPLAPASRAPGWSARCDPAPRTWAVRPSPHILPVGGGRCGNRWKEGDKSKIWLIWVAIIEKWGLAHELAKVNKPQKSLQTQL